MIKMEQINILFSNRIDKNQIELDETRGQDKSILLDYLMFDSIQDIRLFKHIDDLYVGIQIEGKRNPEFELGYSYNIPYSVLINALKSTENNVFKSELEMNKTILKLTLNEDVYNSLIGENGDFSELEKQLKSKFGTCIDFLNGTISSENIRLHDMINNVSMIYNLSITE